MRELEHALTRQEPGSNAARADKSMELSQSVQVQTAKIYKDAVRRDTLRFEKVFICVTLFTLVLLSCGTISSGAGGLLCVLALIAPLFGLLAGVADNGLLMRKPSETDEESGEIEVFRRFQKGGAPWRAPIDSRFSDPLNPTDERLQKKDTTKETDSPVERIRPDLPTDSHSSTEIY
jgi:hypothetical protein